MCLKAINYLLEGPSETSASVLSKKKQNRLHHRESARFRMGVNMDAMLLPFGNNTCSVAIIRDQNASSIQEPCMKLGHIENVRLPT